MRETTVYLDGETSEKLKAIATAQERSKAAQIRYWVNREYDELVSLKLIEPVGLAKAADEVTP